MLDSLQYINSQLVNRVTVITTSALHILAFENTVGDSDVGFSAGFFTAPYGLLRRISMRAWKTAEAECR